MNEEKNYKERVIEMYTKRELPVLKRNEKFNFACVQCGECCRNRDDILLNPFDVFRLCREKKMTLQDFIEKYCEFYTGNSSKLTLMRIQFRLSAFHIRLVGYRNLGKKQSISCKMTEHARVP